MIEPDQNRRSRQIVMALAEDGGGTVQVTEEIRGGDAPGHRNTYQAEGTRAERLERQLRNLFPGLELEESSFSDLDDFNAPVTVRYRARVPQLAVRDGRTLRIAPTTLNDLSRNLATSSSRSLPLDLRGRSAYVEERHVQLPQGFRVSEMPEGGTVESPFGRLTITVRQEGREVVARTELRIQQERIASGDYPEFRRWVEQIDRVLRQRLTLAPGAEQ
jgi:hypothetical protein